MCEVPVKVDEVPWISCLDYLMQTVKVTQRKANWSGSDMLQLLRSPQLELQGQIVTPKVALALDVMKDFASELYDWKDGGEVRCFRAYVAVWKWLCRSPPTLVVLQHSMGFMEGIQTHCIVCKYSLCASAACT